MDYEFRFYRDREFQALHMTHVANDTEACERARLYLRNTPEFSHVEVRRGFQFLRRIDNDFVPGEVAVTIRRQ